MYRNISGVNVIFIFYTAFLCIVLGIFTIVCVCACSPESGRLREAEESVADAGLMSWVRRSYVARACYAAVPLQLFAFMLLGFAALVPLCEQDCVPPNSFLYSLHPLYRYTDGQPPV